MPKPLTHEEMLALQAQSAPNPRDPYTPVESALIGGAQGVTLGFEPQLEGLFRGGYNALTSDKPLSGENLLDAYRSARDNAKSRESQAAADNPKSYTAGNIAGTIGTGFIPGLGFLNAGREAGLVTKLGLGAATGGIAGAGYSDADLTRGDPEQFAKFGKDVGKGAIWGIGTQGLVSGIGGAVKSYLPKAAETVSPQQWQWFHPFDKGAPPSAPGVLDKIAESNPANAQVYDKVAGALPLGFDRAAKLAAPVVRPPIDAFSQTVAGGAVSAAQKINQVLASEGGEAAQKLLQPLIDFAKNGNSSAALTIYLIRKSHPELLSNESMQEIQKTQGVSK